MTLNKYQPFAVVYFFFNTLALPFGLTYTALLAPFFYGWVLLQRRREILLPFLAAMLPFVLLHLLLADAETDAYWLSFINVVLVYIFCQAVYTFLLRCRDVERILRRLLTLNFILCLVSIPVYFSPWYWICWDRQVLTQGVGELRRLKFFTYEPSYYAFLFSPIFCYFLLQYLLRRNDIKGILLVPMIFLPLILSASLGVIGALVIAGIITWLIHFRKLTRQKRIFNTLVNCFATMLFAFILIVVFFRDNPVFKRLANIIDGRDSSGKGRTFDSFILAGKMIRENSEYAGVGFGQVKIAGKNIIGDYYQYNIDFVATIPNAAAETLAIFGWPGFILRIVAEIVLFFHTRVWTNYYRLLMFSFVFIYQFTGSFITNIAEYVIWILAFNNVFSQFDVVSAKKKDASGCLQAIGS